MPCISMFYGIMIYMYNSGKEHNPPHFHVKFNGDFSVFDLEGNLIEGNLPLSKQKLVWRKESLWYEAITFLQGVWTVAK